MVTILDHQIHSTALIVSHSGSLEFQLLKLRVSTLETLNFKSKLLDFVAWVEWMVQICYQSIQHDFKPVLSKNEDCSGDKKKSFLKGAIP